MEWERGLVSPCVKFSTVWKQIDCSLPQIMHCFAHDPRLQGGESVHTRRGGRWPHVFVFQSPILALSEPLHQGDCLSEESLFCQTEGREFAVDNHGVATWKGHHRER